MDSQRYAILRDALERQRVGVPQLFPESVFEVDKWDRRFLELAFMIGSWSKDPSTRCGAVIVAPDRRIVATGYNGFPRGLKDTPAILLDREQKLSRMVHCEMNAVLHAREPLHGCTLYTTPSLSCDRCIVHMLQAGILDFVGPYPHGDFGKRWGPAVQRTRDYILEAGKSYREIDIETWRYVSGGG